jgi:membrane-associated protease RseP (regulator of RpoE activity)
MLNISRIGFATSVVSCLALTGLVRPVAAQSDSANDPNPLRVEFALPVEVAADRIVFFTPDGKTLLSGQEAVESGGKFWIGLRCSNVDGALRAQLGLAEGKGLIVDEVFPDSPARTAGLQQYDVLVKIGGRELAAVTDLVESVQKAEEKEIEVSLIRAGKPQTVKVTPAERTAKGTQVRFTLREHPNPNYHELHTLIEQLRNPANEREVAWRAIRGAAVVNKQQFGTLPKGLSISITKSGDEEAKIAVQRGEQKWETTEKTLDKLPEDVRKSVQEFLGRRQQNAAVRTLPSQTGVGGTVQVNVRPKPPETTTLTYKVLPHVAGTVPGSLPRYPAQDQQLQKQLDEIQKQLESLRKSVEALQTKKE